jgi:glycosyltransferase involved in cell wall biosynthesis
LTRADTKIVISFRRIGPYHHARLSAVARKYPSLIALESTSSDSVYDWDDFDVGEAFEKVTLFCEKDSLQAKTREIRDRVWDALDAILPDIVFINGWQERVAFAQLEWCAQNSVPRVVMSESQEIDSRRNFFVEKIKSNYVKMFGAAICGGESHLQYLTELGMKRDCIFKGYDVIDNEYFSTSASNVLTNQEYVREELGLPDNYFLASSRFIEKKNIIRLLESYKLYVDSDGSSAWKFVLLGDGEMRQEIIDRVNELDLAEHVHMPGFIQYDLLPSYYALAKVFVHASTTEQWGLVVNEAMAAGLPVLVSARCGCAAELVKDGVNGYCFDPHDVHDISEKLMSLASSESDLDELRKGSQRVIAEWSIDRFRTAVEQAARVVLRSDISVMNLNRWLAVRLMYFK